MNAPNILFVDLQGFRASGQFVLKELSISLEHSEAIHHYLFAPPYKWNQLSRRDRVCAFYLKTFHHGFNWNNGIIPYDSIHDILDTFLRGENSLVFVKGRDKIDWLKQLWNGDGILNIQNIEELGSTFDISEYPFECFPHCDEHDRNFQCAYRKVLFLKDQYKKQNE